MLEQAVSSPACCARVCAAKPACCTCKGCVDSGRNEDSMRMRTRIVQSIRQSALCPSRPATAAQHAPPCSLPPFH